MLDKIASASAKPISIPPNPAGSVSNAITAGQSQPQAAQTSSGEYLFSDSLTVNGFVFRELTGFFGMFHFTRFVNDVECRQQCLDSQSIPTLDLSNEALQAHLCELLLTKVQRRGFACALG
jgi:hypothetical protein